METLSHKPYWCFISYRHADNEEEGRTWASWVHHALETYAVPDTLVGLPNGRGELIPSRIFPVFRDEVELPADADLSAPIVSALKGSRTLIVLCSPKSRQSRFVNEEVRIFKALGRPERAVGAIISGDPNSRNEDDCLPPSLRQQVDADGNLLPEEQHHMLVDLRDEMGEKGWVSEEMHRRHLLRSGLGHSLASEEARRRARRTESAKMQLVATVLGVELDALRAAEARAEAAATKARRKRILLASSAGCLLLAGIAANMMIAAGDDTRIAESRETLRKLARTNLQLATAADEATGRADEHESEIARNRAAAIELTNPAEAEKLYAIGVARGHPESVLGLANLLLSGRLGESRRTEGLALLRKAAQTHPGAMDALGRRLVATGGREAKAEGILMLERAVAAGSVETGVALAEIQMGDDPAKARLTLEQAAKKGSSEAAWRLACLLRKGAPGESPDLAAAHKWMQHAAESGRSEAMREAGIDLYEARGVPRNAKDGISLLTKAAAMNDTAATARLLEIYADANNLPKDPAAALAWSLDGAKAGHAGSMLRASRLLRNRAAAERGAMQMADQTNADLWLDKAIIAGDETAAVEKADLALQSGVPSTKLKEALVFFKLHATYGNIPSCLGLARCFLGAARFGKSKKETAQLRKSALLHLLCADIHGNSTARSSLLELLRENDAEGPDADAGLRSSIEEWLRTVITKRGDSDAAQQLGEWLEAGAPRTGKWTEALEAYLQGAALGSGECARRAAMLITSGKTGAGDEHKAAALMRQAAEAGNAEAMIAHARHIAKASPNTDGREEALAWARLGVARGAKRDETGHFIAELESALTAEGRNNADARQGALAKRVGRREEPPRVSGD